MGRREWLLTSKECCGDFCWHGKLKISNNITIGCKQKWTTTRLRKCEPSMVH
jgi:hypothetical protein